MLNLSEAVGVGGRWKLTDATIFQIARGLCVISTVSIATAMSKSKLTSTASRKFRGSLGASRRPFVGPVEGPIGGAIVVRNKGQDTGAQLLHGEATESRKQATDEDAEPDLNLVEKGDCVWEYTRSECDEQGRRERPHAYSYW